MAPMSVKGVRSPAMAAATDAAPTAPTADGTDGTDVADAKRDAAARHVLDATRRLVGAEGLDVTMDQIAEAAGVSRRTLFRHFGTRERLITAAFTAGLARYGEQLPTFDAATGDWRAWLTDTCRTVHRLNARYGPGYWQLATGTDLPPDLARFERRRRELRRAAMARIADTLWTASGGEGPTPDALVATVGAHLSAHFTAAVTTDVGAPAATAAELAESAILAALG